MFATTWLHNSCVAVRRNDSETVWYNPGHRPNTRWVEALRCYSVTTHQLHLIKDPLLLHHISENELGVLSQKDVIESMNVFYQYRFGFSKGRNKMKSVYVWRQITGKLRLIKKRWKHMLMMLGGVWGGSCLAGGTSITALMHVDWALISGAVFGCSPVLFVCSK